MIKRTFRGFIQLLGGLGAGLAIIAMLAAWQLSSGPISLAFLSPYIENAVNAGHKSFKLSLEDTILTWAGWQRTLDIRVINVKALRPDGSLIGSVPEVSFSLSGKALIGGLIAPSSIELFGPRLRIRREVDGTIDIGFQETEGQSGEIGRRLIGQLLAAPDSANPMSYLSRLEVVSAEVAFEDRQLGKSWVAPAADVSLRRDTLGLKGSVKLEIDVDRRRTEIAISGNYVTAQRRFDLIVDFHDISPAVFSSMYYELGPLRAFALPLQGTVTLGVTTDGRVLAAGFNLKGGKGVFDLPQPIAQPLAVESVVLKGHFEGEKNTIDVDDLTVGLGREGVFRLPGPANHDLPLASVSAKGRYFGDTGRLEVTQLAADLRGPTAELQLVADGFPGKNSANGDRGMAVDVTGALRDVPVDQLRRYWPATWGADVHKWVVGHLTDGVMHQARVRFRLRPNDKGALEFLSVDGDMEASGVSVDYLPPMPPVRNAAAYMKFNEKRFDVFVSEGKSEGLTVREGTILFTGLDEVDQYADIALSVEGSFGDQLAYLEHEPLRYASAIEIDPKSTKGTAQTQLKLQFLLEKALTLDGVKVSAKSKVTGVSAAKAVLGRDISDGKLDIRVDKKGMDLTGAVNIGRIPATLVWRENFDDKRKFRRRYNVRARITDTRQLADLNPNLSPFTEKFIRGELDAEVDYTIFNDDRRRLDIKTDITGAELLAPAFGWSKKPGVVGEAKMAMEFKGERITAVPSFTVNANDLDIQGLAHYRAGKGELQRIDFDRVAYGRTDIKGALIARPDGGWDAGCHGPSFDMTSMWTDIIHGGSAAGKDDDFRLPYLTLAVELDRVWIGSSRSVNRISGTFAHKDDLWRTILVKGEIGDKKHFELSIRPGADGNRNLLMTSADAGETLKLMDYFDNMVGGRLEITGRYNDSLPTHPLIGRLTVGNYRVTNAPLLTHVLSIMALTGIVEAMQGRGLAFGTLDVPFVLGDGWLEIKQAKATGASLGFTASGTVYTHADVIDINGTVVPAYAINSALGRLPVIGDIFTGGEKGGGVFAANFAMSGPAADPKVTVNPLSALTPGIFRNVFDIFGQADFGTSRPGDTGIQ